MMLYRVWIETEYKRCSLLDYIVYRLTFFFFHKTLDFRKELLNLYETFIFLLKKNVYF